MPDADRQAYIGLCHVRDKAEREGTKKRRVPAYFSAKCEEITSVFTSLLVTQQRLRFRANSAWEQRKLRLSSLRYSRTSSHNRPTTTFLQYTTRDDCIGSILSQSLSEWNRLCAELTFLPFPNYTSSSTTPSYSSYNLDPVAHSTSIYNSPCRLASNLHLTYRVLATDNPSECCFTLYSATGRKHCDNPDTNKSQTAGRPSLPWRPRFSSPLTYNGYYHSWDTTMC